MYKQLLQLTQLELKTDDDDDDNHMGFHLIPAYAN